MPDIINPASAGFFIARNNINLHGNNPDVSVGLSATLVRNSMAFIGQG